MSNNLVQSTIRYGLFSFARTNRKIDFKHVDRLEKAILEKNMLDVNPIVVNSSYEILDGQHRFMVAKKNNLPVHYMVANNVSMDDVPELNTLKKAWSPADSLHSFCEKGLENYLILRDFVAKHNVSLNIGMILLAGSKKFTDRGAFKLGTFKVNDIETATTVAERIKDYKQYYKGAYRRSFVLAIFKITRENLYDHAAMKHKMKLQQIKLVDCVNTEDYLKLLESIYNYKVHEAEKKRFF